MRASVIVAVLSSAISQAAVAGTWQPAQSLGTGVINDAASAMNASGDAIVVWNACPPSNEACGKFLSRSRPAGGTWSAAENASSAAGGYDYVNSRWLSLADNGLATLIHTTTTGMSVRRKPPGKPWSAPVEVVSGLGVVGSDHAGDIAIYSGNDHVYLSRAGGQFADLGVAVTATPALPRTFVSGVAVSVSGDVVVVYTDYQCTNPNASHCSGLTGAQTYGARFAPGATQWETQPIGPVTTVLPVFNVFTDDSGRAAAVLYNYDSTLSGYNQPAAGKPWTASATTHVDGFLADIGIDAAGNLTALISNNNVYSNVLWASTVTGTAWQQQHVVPTPAYNGFRLALAPAGSAMLSWIDYYTNGTYKLRAITRPAATPTWSAPQAIKSTSMSGQVFKPSASSNGSALTISSIGSSGLIGSVYTP